MEHIFEHQNLDFFYPVHRIADAAIVEGDCLQVLKKMPDNSVDSVVCDPPYGLSFMGKRWDYDVPSTEVWAECLRVLKPGGHLLAFAGTRTQHRMAVRIEDAGFEIRDMIAWVYGSGFPKSLDVSKAIDKAAGAEREVAGQRKKLQSYGADVNDVYGGGPDKGGVQLITATDAARQWQGWGTALKPALEPITVARKPLAGTVAANVLVYSTGVLNIDGCRVPVDPEADAAQLRTMNRSQRDGDDGWGMSTVSGDTPQVVRSDGRWPANLIHDGSDEVVVGFPGEADGSAARFFQRCEGVYNSPCQDQNPTPSSADTAVQSSCLLNHLAATVQNAVAIWPSLAGILSSEQTAASTPVTLNESKAISETAMQAMSSIASGFSQESQHERLTPCGSLVRTAATQKPTGTTTITTSLCRSDGSAGVATFTITPSNLDRGEAVFRFNYCAKASKSDRGEGNTHPTVKPTDLMAYLCRLVTPPGGVVLDPFMGSGSTGKAAMREGLRFIGCELSPEYMAIARARILNAVSK